MGTTVIGGMVAASAVGIFFIPAIFCVIEKWSGAATLAEPGRPQRNSTSGEGTLALSEDH
jgi:hypothetical protein